jgi:hypothetical protein
VSVHVCDPDSKLPTLFLTTEGWQISKPQQGDDVYPVCDSKGKAPTGVGTVNLEFTHTPSGVTVTETKTLSIGGVSINWTGGVGVMQVGQRESGTLTVSGTSPAAGVDKLTVVPKPDIEVSAKAISKAAAPLAELLGQAAAIEVKFVKGAFDPATDFRVTCILTPEGSPAYPIKVFDGIPFGKMWFAFFTTPVKTFPPHDPYAPPYLMRVLRTNLDGDVTHRETQTVT